ncbi:MAG: SRPBCC domain-containing protein [Bacteroidota bacterium]
MKTEVLEPITKDTRNRDFTYAFESSKSTKEIYDLLLETRKWWTGFYAETITGNSEAIGDEFEFYAGGGAHYSKHKLIALVPFEKIVWEVTDSTLSFLSKTDEWIGSKIRFDISDKGNLRYVTFTHEGLIPKFECYSNCSNAWTEYMKQLEVTLK